MIKYRLVRIAVTAVAAGTMLALVLVGLCAQSPQTCAGYAPPDVEADARGAPISRTQIILVDDLEPQPYQGDSIYYYNRLGGDRGVLNDSIANWGRGQVTVTIGSGKSWGGIWMSLNHPIREQLPVDFAALFPAAIRSTYQSQITGLAMRIAGGTAGKTLRVELKDSGAERWRGETTLSGGPQTMGYDLFSLGEINEVVLVLDGAAPGDQFVLDQVSLTATTPITDVAWAAFTWSYGMLLDNWNPDTGLVRDKAKDASGEFDAVQSTGALAAATAMADQLGVVSRADALRIVEAISHTLLISTPRYSGEQGLWPHWVEMLPSGALTIAQDTEWSSVDTTIAAVSLLLAQEALELDTTGTEEVLRGIDWDHLRLPTGLSHGYTYTRELITYTWDTFGGETWLLALAHAAVNGEAPPVAFPMTPTANGSGFIDELAWLFVPPPPGRDRWGVEWSKYREQAADEQIEYFCRHYPTSCFCKLGLFGLSAGEVPDPASVAKDEIYQAFAIGGQHTITPNDGITGTAQLGALVVAPHYSAMVSDLRPREATQMWAWLINEGPFTPLNNVESLMFPPGATCSADEVVWNQLKGSWNLSLQALGWGRYLAQRQGQVPVLWSAMRENLFLRRGYATLATAQFMPIIVRNQEQDACHVSCQRVGE